MIAGWFGRLTPAGLLPLALAIVLMLPGVAAAAPRPLPPGRRPAPRAVAVYGASKPEGSHLRIYGASYWPAAAVLAVAGMRAALARPGGR